MASITSDIPSHVTPVQTTTSTMKVKLDLEKFESQIRVAFMNKDKVIWQIIKNVEVIGLVDH
jgi:hypothetical protein